MNSRRPLELIAFILAFLIISGCSKSREDYRTGMYWLEKENNWEMAVRAFKRSLDHDKDNWKIHSKLLETMGMGANPADFEAQLRNMLSYFPDSARAQVVVRAGYDILGQKRYDKIASSFELNYLGALLAKNPGNKTVLARSIMASCRVGDTLAAIDYFSRMLAVTEGKNPDDSLLQELRFFVGPTQLEWLRLDWRINHLPADPTDKLAQLPVGVLLGDSAGVRKRISELARNNPDLVENEDLKKSYGRVAGIDPFTKKVICEGWEASFSRDQKAIVFIKDLGNEKSSDLYLYYKPLSGGKEKPVLKAGQQRMGSLAWPKFSPDGKWIYFYASEDKAWHPGIVGRFHLYRVRPTYGSVPQKLTESAIIAADFSFGEDGSVFFVRADIGSSRSSVEVMKLKPEQQEISPVSRIGEPVSGATFSPDGDSLIFIADRGIFRRSIQGGKIIVDVNWLGMSFPQVSPDGRYLKMINRKGHLLLIHRDTRKPIFLGTAASTWICFGKNGDVLLTEITDGVKKIVQINLDDPLKKTVSLTSITG